ncbi:TPA: hypothetical protein ACH3X2_011101 [Trebouxia sp. C0005]
MGGAQLRQGRLKGVGAARRPEATRVFRYGRSEFCTAENHDAAAYLTQRYRFQFSCCERPIARSAARTTKIMSRVQAPESLGKQSASSRRRSRTAGTMRLGALAPCTHKILHPGLNRGNFQTLFERHDSAKSGTLGKHRHSVIAQGRFQDVVDMDKAIPGSTKPSSPKPDAAFVANQLVVRAAAKFNAEDESGDRWGALADLKQADKLQPNDLPTLQLRALVRLKLGDARGFLDDLHGRADTAQWLERKAYVSCSTGDDEQAVEDLVAADHISPGAADKAHHPHKEQGCGGCETEYNQLQVAVMHLADQGMLLLVRSTLVRMMALSAATHCFKTLRSETVESRQKHCLALQYNLALCTGRLGLSPPPADAREWPLYGHPADNSLYMEQLDNHSSTAKDTSSTKGVQHLMTANMLYTQRKYPAALDELEQANALMPDHYTVLHLWGMCKAELNQYEDAIADLTGRAHYCNALFSRGMCHLNLGNHKQAFDDIVRADILDSKVGDTFCASMQLFAAIDPGNPQVQKTAQIHAALEKRKKSCLKVWLDTIQAPITCYRMQCSTEVTLKALSHSHTRGSAGGQ